MCLSTILGLIIGMIDLIYDRYYRFNIRSIHVVILQPPSGHKNAVVYIATRKYPPVIRALNKHNKPLHFNLLLLPHMSMFNLHSSLIYIYH